MFCNWRRVFASKLPKILFWFCLQIVAQYCTHFVINSICLLWITLILFYNCQLESYVLFNFVWIPFYCKIIHCFHELFYRHASRLCNTCQKTYAIPRTPLAKSCAKIASYKEVMKCADVCTYVRCTSHSASHSACHDHKIITSTPLSMSMGLHSRGLCPHRSSAKNDDVAEVIYSCYT